MPACSLCPSLVFSSATAASIVQEKVFVTHGGVGPEPSSADEVGKLDRFQEDIPKGVMEHLLWNDPADENGALKTWGNMQAGSVPDWIRVSSCVTTTGVCCLH